MTTAPKYIIGSVSHGTMREEDLIPCFMDVLEHFDPDKAKAYREDTDLAQVWAWLDDNIGDDEPDWDLISSFLNEDLFDALNEYAPPYFYFGAHPGDGCDYGFWLSEGFEQDFEDTSANGVKVSDLSDVPEGHTGEVLHVNDHGNCTLYSCKDGKLTEIWAVV